MGIDIAIDLKGYTQEGRSQLFAFRPAPLQVNYLGYPGTLGADFMDYIIADPVVIPSGQEHGYSEKIIRLPQTYQPNDRRRMSAASKPSRTACGLPEGAFVFCCFNNNFKITPNVFSIWMEILRAAEGSVLWLYEDNEQACVNLRREASSRGVDPARLVFARKQPLPDHLARLQLADLVLDTRPYNAHTTASDALWVGVPVLTQPGESFVSRVAASLLTAIGLPELIMQTEADYRQMAIALAQDQAKHASLREKLAHNRVSQPLFDAPLYTRHLEQAYQAIHARHLQGLAPDHIDLREA
jgi:predicted O-linked N-acetylglucosamine transferase (SPINDLY family)